jgi:hypothetical protein
MSELIEKINQDLVTLEERFLNELRRLRKLEQDALYSNLDASLKQEFTFIRDSLAEVLEHSGDRQNLSLRSARHEQMLTRLDVLRNLLARKIPTAFIESSHAEVKLARQNLEFQVMNSRQEESGNTGGGRLNKVSGGKQTPEERARNPNQISKTEAAQFDTTGEFMDGGIYSASRELAVLEKLVRLHHIDGQSIDQVLQARAQFRPRDLSRGHASDRTGGRGFAQSPEEIRAKLARQQTSPNTSKASFLAKEIPPPPAVPDKPLEKSGKKEPPAPVTGKAVFGARDIEPLAPQEFRERRPSKKNKPQPPAEKPVGKAVFESKDLSDPGP